MRKDKVTHLSHDPQRLSLTPSSTAKLPLDSDPVLKNKFESALKSAGSTINIFTLATDNNLLEPNHSLDASHNPLVELPFSSIDDPRFNCGVKKKSTTIQDKVHHKLSINTEVTIDNSPQLYGSIPYTIITDSVATKTNKNGQSIPLTTFRQQQPTKLSVSSLADKTSPNSQTKTPFFTDDLSNNQPANQTIKSADLAKPITISPQGKRTTITYPANYQPLFANKKTPSASTLDKLANPIDAILPPKEKQSVVDKILDKEKRTEISIEQASLPAVLSAATTTEKILATVDHEKTSASLLNTLFNKLNAVINVDVNKNYQPPIIQLNLPQIGHLQIKIQQEQQNIMIEFVAQTMGQKILLDHRQDLIDKLQRIHPEQHIQLVILNDQQSKERSKDQPQSSDDFEEEMI